LLSSQNAGTVDQKYKRSSVSKLAVISCATLSVTVGGALSTSSASQHPVRASAARASTILSATTSACGCARHCASDATAQQSSSCPRALLMAQSTPMSLSSSSRDSK